MSGTRSHFVLIACAAVAIAAAATSASASTDGSIPLVNSVCNNTEYCCPDAKHCLLPTNTSCLDDPNVCAKGQVCCPLTKLCVTAHAPCTTPCESADSFCCPEARHCLSPTRPGILCNPEDKTSCLDDEVCCPVIKECVRVGDPCTPP